MRKSTIIAASIGLFALGLVVIGSRNVLSLGSFARVSADQAIDDFTDSLPDKVHDRKLSNELSNVRDEMIDRQVQLTQSKNQLRMLEQSVAKLEASVSRRKSLLAEAYPVLRDALQQKSETVRFASLDLDLEEFQLEVDELIALQNREEDQLVAARSSLQRLEASTREGEMALAEMRHALDATEQEVVLLQSRRDQAEIESKTLEMIAHVSSDYSRQTETLGHGLARLRGQVDQLEAENDAKRTLAPASGRMATNQLSVGWDRMEALEALHTEAKAEEEQTNTDATAHKEEDAATASVDLTDLEAFVKKVRTR